MITLEQAIEIALQAMRDALGVKSEREEKLVIMPDKTIEREFGWVFFIVWNKYLETNDIAYLLPFGVGPITVRRNGTTFRGGSGPYVNDWLRALRDGTTDKPFDEYLKGVLGNTRGKKAQIPRTSEKIIMLDDAIEIALQLIVIQDTEQEAKLVFVTDEIIEREFGWVFCVEWDKFLKTNTNISSVYYGGKSIFVGRNGEAYSLGHGPYVNDWLQALRDGTTDKLFDEYLENILSSQN